jgi:hypothetical protein
MADEMQPESPQAPEAGFGPTTVVKGPEEAPRSIRAPKRRRRLLRGL